MPARTSAAVAPEVAMRFKFLDVIRFLLLALNVADGFRVGAATTGPTMTLVRIE
jgi:hypothetical protein